jgi:hypothetical protein
MRRGTDLETYVEGIYMRRGWFFLFFLLVVIIVVGIYRGWFTVNKEKIKEDEQRAVEKIKEGTEKAKAGLDQELNKGKPVEPAPK